MTLGAGTGAALLAVTVTGDVLFLGVVLGVAALDAVAGATAVLAGIGVLGRWGSTSLAALAGGQAVLGPAGWTGSAAAVLSSWGAAVALVLVAPRDRVPAAAFGLLAAAVVAGPAVTDVSDVGALALRVAASVAFVAAAWVCGRVVPRPVGRTAGLILAAAAALLAFTS